MDKNKIIILALIVIIAAILVGAVAMMPSLNKKDTKLTIKGNSTITEGDSIKIKLTDDNGTKLGKKEVNITITDEENTSDYHSVVTDSKGIGTLKLDKSAGNYTITANYAGDENYTGCNATKKITIEEKVVIEESTSSSSYSNSQSESDGYWESSIYAPFEYHTEYDSSGGFRQYDKKGNLVGSSYDEDQDKIADYVPRRI